MRRGLAKAVRPDNPGGFSGKSGGTNRAHMNTLAAYIFRQALGPLLAMLERPLLLPSTRLAQLAGELGFRQPLVADDASDDALLTCLLQWRARNAETLLA